MRALGSLRHLRAFVTRVLIAAGLMLGLMPAAAHAAGPGVTMYFNTIPRPVDYPGEQFSGGMTIRQLISDNGVDPASVTFVNVTRPDGGQIALTQSGLGAVIIDNGTTTRFVGGGQTVTATAATGPLQISVNGGDMVVVAAVNRSVIEEGQSVSLSARVRFAPPGAQLEFEWDFNDGTPPQSGRFVSHVYKTPGQYQARITVRGTSGSTGRCATGCVGVDDVDITVGEGLPEELPAPGTPGGTGTGSGSGAGSGSGQGGAGGTGSGTGTDPSGTEDEPTPAVTPEPKPEPKPKPAPKPEKPFGVPISGVLIDDIGAVVKKLPQGKEAGAAAGRRQSESSPPDGTEIQLAGLLALAFISLGALRERRGVRLRLA